MYFSSPTHPEIDIAVPLYNSLRIPFSFKAIDVVENINIHQNEDKILLLHRNIFKIDEYKEILEDIDFEKMIIIERL